MARPRLANPILNRVTAFTPAERRKLNLEGLLPIGLTPSKDFSTVSSLVWLSALTSRDQSRRLPGRCRTS